MPDSSPVVDIIADVLSKLAHPGSPGVEPHMIQLTMFKTAGLPQQIAEQVNSTKRLVAEGLVHTLDLAGYEIVKKTP